MKKALYGLLLIISIGVMVMGVLRWKEHKLKQSFAQKTYWAVCTENQGMVTHEIFMYDDTTYYADILGETHVGTYELSEEEITFNRDNGWAERSKKAYVFEGPNCSEGCRLISKNFHEDLIFHRKTGVGFN